MDHQWKPPESLGRAFGIRPETDESARTGSTADGDLQHTAPTWYFARWIRTFGWPTISLVHDFATNSSKNDYRLVADSADLIVYPCDAMKAVACRWAELPEDHGVVQPQGLIREDFLDGRNDDARSSFRRRLGLDDDAIIVLGCGSLELRKGPELFLLTALAALRNGVDPRVHFAWIGSGAETYLDPTSGAQGMSPEPGSRIAFTSLEKSKTPKKPSGEATSIC